MKKKANVEKELADLRRRVAALEGSDDEETTMSEDEALAYLKRKGRKATREELKKVMKEGKIYGDPVVELG